MVILWGVGGLLVGLGALLVVVLLLRRGGSAENQRLGVVAGLVMTGLGVVAISAAALAGGDDDNDTETTGAETASSSTTSPDGKDGDEATTDGGSSTTEEEEALPECIEEHLSAEPVVAEQDHYRLDEGVSRQVIVIMHAADAIALELVDGDELLGVMRIGDQALPVNDTLHVFDVVDDSCQPLPLTPQDTEDEAAQTHRTVVPLDLAGGRYEVTFVQDGIEPELDVVLRRVP